MKQLTEPLVSLENTGDNLDRLHVYAEREVKGSALWQEVQVCVADWWTKESEEESNHVLICPGPAR